MGSSGAEKKSRVPQPATIKLKWTDCKAQVVTLACAFPEFEVT